MATYTSTQAGNWSSDAVWGGSGHPNVDDDVVNINHEVFYDMGVSSILWGNITIGTTGKLIFPTNASSDLLFNSTGILTINGEMSCGTEVSPLDAAYKLRVLFTRGSAVANRLVAGTGDAAKVFLYGSPGVYGSQKYGYLAINWESGQTFYVDGDVSSVWSAGLIIFVYRNIIFDTQATNGGIFTIASVGTYDSANDRTPITINEAAPGVIYNSGGDVIVISRNIVFQEIGLDIEHTVPKGTTSHTRLVFGQNINLDQQKMFNCLFACLYTPGFGGHGPHYKNSVIVRCYYPVINAYGPILEETDIIMCSGEMSSSVYISGKIADCSKGCSGSPRNLGLGDLSIIGCSSAMSGGPGKIHARIRGCGALFSSSYLMRVSGTIDNVTTLLGVIPQLSLRPSGIIDNAIIDGVFRPLTIVSSHGDITSLNSNDAGWQAPPSGESYIFKADPKNTCRPVMSYSFQLPEPPEYMMHKFPTAGNKTITFKIFPVGWSTDCDNNDIRVVAMYASNSAGLPATAITPTGTFANDGWRDLTVTFNLQNASVPVSFHVQFRRYELAGYWLIDPDWSVS